jgi:hypothetical protein
LCDTLQGNDFQMQGNQVTLGTSANKAVITGNMINGPLKVNNLGMKSIPQIALNAYDGAIEL